MFENISEPNLDSERSDDFSCSDDLNVYSNVDSYAMNSHWTIGPDDASDNPIHPGFGTDSCHSDQSFDHHDEDQDINAYYSDQTVDHEASIYEYDQSIYHNITAFDLHQSFLHNDNSHDISIDHSVDIYDSEDTLDHEACVYEYNQSMVGTVASSDWNQIFDRATLINDDDQSIDFSLSSNDSEFTFDDDEEHRNQSINRYHAVEVHFENDYDNNYDDDHDGDNDDDHHDYDNDEDHHDYDNDDDDDVEDVNENLPIREVYLAMLAKALKI